MKATRVLQMSAKDVMREILEDVLCYDLHLPKSIGQRDSRWLDYKFNFSRFAV